MSVVGDKVAVVSLGMSCQTAVQIRDHVSVIAASAGDATLRPSALPFDSIVCHPASAVKMLQAEQFYPATSDKLALYRGALWTDYGVYFRHECTLRKSHPIEYLRRKVNLARGHRELAAKFAYLGEKFRRLSEVDRLVFVLSNSQNDLGEYWDEVGISSTFAKNDVETLCDECDRFFGRSCEYILAAYDSRLVGTTERRGLQVFRLVPDASGWAGDHAQWRKIFETALHRVDAQPSGSVAIGVQSR